MGFYVVVAENPAVYIGDCGLIWTLNSPVSGLAVGFYRNTLEMHTDINTFMEPGTFLLP